MPTSSSALLRRLVTVASCLLATTALLTPRVHAQTTVLTFDTNYSATNLSQWGSGGASGVSYSTNLGVAWSESFTFGSFSTGLFGEEWGAGGTASISGNAGFNAHFSTNGGSVDIRLPNKIRLSAPSDVNALTPTIGITQDRSALAGGDMLTSIFPHVNLGIGAYYNIDAQVSGRVAYGFGSTSGTVTLKDLFTAAFPQLAASAAVSGLDPFHANFNTLLGYNSATSVVTVMDNPVSLGNGITIPLTTKHVLSSNTILPGPQMPVQNRLGTVTINPTVAGLNAASGSGLTTNNAQTTMAAASIDILGIVTTAFGLPVNPFDIRAQIPDTPIDLNLMALSLNPHIDIGVRQKFELYPRTFLGLSSNYDVTYQYQDSHGVTRTVTTRDLTYQLPDDGSASSLTIINRPAESDWQLFSRVFVDPQLLNQLYLTIGGGVDIQALRLAFSAYGAGASLGPLLDVDLSFGSADILIYSTLIDLEGGNFSRVYRNPIPLFGTGVVRNLTVGAEDEIQFFGQSGSFDTSVINGQLTLRDAGFINTVPLTVNGTLHLDVTTNNGVDLSANDVRTPQLFVGQHGTVQVDRNSELTVTGLKTSGSADILDSHGNRQVGFITATGPDSGAINSGAFILGGTLSYDGPQITAIGSGVRIELLPSGLLNGTDLGRRFNNYHGSADPEDAIDGLRDLAHNSGTLIIAGQDLLLQSGALANAGNLAVLNGYHLYAPLTDFTNTAGATVSIGSGSSMTFDALAASNLAGGALMNMTLNLAGVFSYAGSRPATLAASTSILLAGARPTDGYVQAGGLDALALVTANAGTLRLQSGATQTVGGTNSGLTNSGALTIDGASTLTVNGALTNSSTLTLGNGGALTASGPLTNVASSTLTGGTWALGGKLTYGGTAAITNIAANTHVTISGAGHGFFNTNGNAFSTLAGLASGSSLSLLNGAALTSSGTLAANGALTLTSGATLTLGGLSAITHPLDLTGATLTTGSLPLAGSQLSFSGALTLAGTLNYSGAAVTGIAGGTTIKVGTGGTFLRNGSNGWSTLDTVAGTLNLAGGTVRTDASLALANDANAAITLGTGGTLEVTGATLTLNPNGNFNQAGGTLVLGGGAHQTALNLDRDFSFHAGNVHLGSVAVTANYATTTGTGQLVTADGFTLTNSANILGAGDIRGGELVNRGSLNAAGGTLTISDLDSPLLNTGILGAMGTAGHTSTLVLDGVTVTNSETVGSTTTDGTVQTYTTLALRNGTTINGGNVNIYSGGTLDSEGATLNVASLAINGGFLVRRGPQTSLTGTVLVGNTGSLTLETGAGADAAATLDFGTGATFTNRGNVTFGAGARMTNITIQNQGLFNLGSGLTNLNNIVNGAGGTINLLNGSTLELATANFSNGGLIHLSGEAPATTSHSTFRLTSDLELSGGGTIQLGGYNTSVASNSQVNVANTIWTNAGTGTLTGTTGQNYKLTLANQQLIGNGTFGDGQIWIENQAGGVIGAYGDGKTLTISTTAYNAATDTGGFINAGRLDVGTGATMRITGDFRSLDANNALATGTYRIGGTLQIDSLGNTTAFDNKVGIVFDGNSARLANAAGATVNFLNNLATGSIAIANGTYTLNTSSNSLTNAGLLRAAPGGTLAVTGGNFTNFSGSTLTGGSYESAGTFKFDHANIVTLANASLTLRGSGTFTDAAGTNALTNFANLTNSSLYLRDGAGFTINAGTFTNTNGRIYVSHNSSLTIAGNTLNTTSSGGTTPDYWIAGNLHTTTNNQVPAGAHSTFFGGAARLNFTDQFLPGYGHLTLAGNAKATYATGTVLTNQGLWEIGSSTAMGPDGTTLRSAAQVTFGGTAANPFAINNSGTIRYYGGGVGFGDQPVDDGSQSRFTADHLRINGGTFDASGAIVINAGGSFEMTGVLANTEGDLDIIFAAGSNVFKLTGGLDLRHDLEIFRGTLDFTYQSGYPVGISGFTFAQAGLNFGPATTGNISLRNNGLLVNSTTGRSAIENVTMNSHTMTFAAATGAVSDNNPATLDHTFLSNFTNASSGTLNVSSTTVSFGGDLDNYGILNANGGSVIVAGDFYNAYHASYGGQPSGSFSGGLNVRGNAYLGSAGTFSGSGTVDGIVVNEGLLDSSCLLRIGRYLQNEGTLYLSPFSTRTLDGTGWAHVENLGTLHVYGLVRNPLGGGGTIHTTSDTEFLGNNQYLTGHIKVDSGSLTVATPDSAGLSGQVTLADQTTLNLGSNFGTVPAVFMNQTFTLGSNVTLQGIGTNGGGINTGITTSHALAINGLFSLDYLNGTSLTLGGVGVFPVGQLSLGGGSLSGDLAGSGRVIVTGNNWLDLYAGSSLTGSIELGQAGSSLFVRGGSALNPNIINHGNVYFYNGGSLAYHGGINGTGHVAIGQYTAATFDHQQLYTGTTTIGSGSSLMFATGTGSVGGVIGDIVNHGALILNHSGNAALGRATVGDTLGNTTTHNYTVSGDGSITQAGSGTVTVYNSTFLNHLTVASGTVKIGDGSTAFSGTLPTITNNAQLTFAHTGDATIAVNGTGNILHNASGNLNLTINGANANTLVHSGTGTLTLPAGQSFTGSTRVQGTGVLEVYADSSLGAAPTAYTAEQLYVRNGGTLRSLGADVTLDAHRGLSIGNATIDTFGTLTFLTSLNGGAITKTGYGRLNMVLDPTKGFAATLNQGSLRVDNLGAYNTPGVFTSAENTQLIFAGSGTTNLYSADNSIRGKLVIEAGTLGFAGTVFTPVTDNHANGLIEIAAGATLTNLGQTDSFYRIEGDGHLIMRAATAHGVSVGSALIAGDFTADTFSVGSLAIQNAELKVLTRGNAGNLSFSGANSTLEVADENSSFLVTGTLTNTGFSGYNLTKTGDGTLSFQSATINANLVVNAGALQLTNHTAVNGVISGAGRVFIGSGLDSITFAQDHTYTGGTIISIGELVLGNGGTTGSVLGEINTGTTYGYAGVAFNRSDDLTVTNTFAGNGWLRQAGTNTITIASSLAEIDASGETPVITNRDLKIDSGTIALTDGAAGLAKITNNSSLVFTNTGDLTLDPVGYILSNDNISGTGTVQQLGTGTTTLAGNNTYTGTTTVSAGQLVYTTAFANAGGITVGSVAPNSPAATLSIAGHGSIGGHVTNYGTFSLDRTDSYSFATSTTGDGVVLKNGAGVATLGSYAHTNFFNIADGELRAFVSNPGDTATFNAVIYGLGTFSKTGSGVLILTGGTNYNALGGLNVMEGRVRIASSNAYDTAITVSAGAILEIASNFSHARDLDVSGSLRVLSGNFDVSGAITNANPMGIASGASLTLRDGGSITGLITNSGNLIFDYGLGTDNSFAATTTNLSNGYFIQQGAGKVTLTGNNLSAFDSGSGTYQGGAIINADSTLALSGSGAISGTITNHGTLEIIAAAGSTRGLANNVTGSGSVLLSGGGTVSTTDNLSYTGATTVASGTTFEFYTGAGLTKTLSTEVTGGGNFHRDGGGTLVVTRNSLVAGTVTNGLGTLQFGDGLDAAHDATITGLGGFINQGTLVFNYAANTHVFTTDITDPARSGTIRQSGNTLTINADITANNLVVDAGRTLFIGSDGSYDANLQLAGKLHDLTAGNLTLAQGLAGTGTGEFIRYATGSLTLNRATDFAGTLTLGGALITEGQFNLRLDRISATSLSNSSGQLTITGNNSIANVTNSGTLTLGNGGTTGQIIGTIYNNGRLVVNRSDTVYLGSNIVITADSGLGTIRQSGPGTTVIQDFVTASAFEATGGTLAFDYYTANRNASIITAPGGNVLFSGSLTHNNYLAGNGLITIGRAASTDFTAAAGDITFSNAGNIYGGAITVLAGSSLTLRSAANVVDHSQRISGQLSGGGDLNYTGTGTLALDGGSALTGLITTAGSRISSGGSFASDVQFGSAGTLEFTNSSAATFGGSLASSTALIHNGTGALTLDRLFSGSATINTGTLLLGANGSLSGALTLANASAAIVQLNKATTLTSLHGGGGLGGTVFIGANSLTLNQALFTSSTYAGSLSGAGDFTKNGAGTVTLSGDNTITGNITVNAGTLALTGAGSATGYTVNNGARLEAGSIASLGGSTSSFNVGLNNGAFHTNHATTLSSAQNIVLTNGGSLSGDLTLDSTVTGTGDLAVNGGRVEFNGAAYTGNVVVNNGATLALGNANAINAAKTFFTSATFDLNGHDWSAALDAHDMTIASFNGRSTVSSTLTTGTNLNFDGNVTFTGDIVATDDVYLRTRGNVIFGDTAAGNIGTLAVLAGRFEVSAAALSKVSAVVIGGDILFTGGGTLGDGSLAFAATGGSLLAAQGSSLSINGGFNVGNGSFSIGGDGGLTLIGQIGYGQGSLTKVGAGHVDLTGLSVSNWDTANSGARLLINEGSLAATTAFLQNRGLAIQNQGTLTLTDASTNALTLRTLDGNGTLNLASRNLVMNLGNSATFTGTLTAANVTHYNSAGSAGFEAATQTYGTLNANSLAVYAGNVVVTDALNARNLTVWAADTHDINGNVSNHNGLTTTLAGISINGGTTLDANFEILGTVRLTGGAAITGNANNLFLRTAQARLFDDQGATQTLGHLATNTGTIALTNGASVTGAAPVFTNSGTSGSVTISNSTWSGFDVINNQGGINSSFVLDATTLTANRFNQTSGAFTMYAGSAYAGTAGGNALSNPGFVMTGGTFTASGTLSGGAVLNGGTTNIGGYFTVGTLTINGGVSLGNGARLVWDFANASDPAGVGHDLLQIVNTAGTTDGKLTLGGNYSATNPIFVDVYSTTGGNVPGFNAAADGSWTIATTTDGFVNFSSDRFFVTGSDLSTVAFGNFGVVTHGNTLELVYNLSTVFNNSSAAETQNGVIAATTPFGGVRIYGAQNATLNLANTYTGNTVLDFGTLTVGHNQALGTGTLVFNSGTLRGDGTARTLANTIVLAGGNITLGGNSNLTFTGAMSNFSAGNRTVAITNTGVTTFGDVNLLTGATARTMTFNTGAAAGTTVIAGTIANGGNAAGRLTKSGAGLLQFTGTNTYTGVTAISNNGGTLQLGNGGTTGSILGDVTVGTNATLSFNRSNALSFTGAISGTGKVTQVGPGITTLTGTNTYLGATTVSAGTLQFGKVVSLANSATLVVATGATAAFNVGGTGEFSASDLANIASLGTATTGFQNGSFLGFDTTNAANGVFVYNGNLTNTHGGANALGLTKLGTGTLQLGGNNTYSGATNVVAGTLQLGSATALSPNTTLNVTTGATFDTNGYAQAFATLSGTGAINVGSTGISVSPNTTNTYSGSLTGTGGLTMNGTGTLVLNNSTNNFSGPVTVSSGTLQVGAAGALSSGLNVALNNTATLNLANHSTTVGALTGNGAVTLGSATLTLAPTATPATFAGSITGSGGVIVTGGSTVILTGTNTYSGNTTVNAAGLVVNGFTTGSDFTVNSGGSLGGSGSIGDLTLNRGATLAPGNSPGTLTVAGDATWSGGANYDWQMQDATAAAGTGYDLVSISGSLTINATSASRFAINVLSILADDTAGNAINFNSTINSSYTIASATSIIGFDASAFTINSTGFTNALNGGTWNLSLGNSNRDLQLNFTATAIPEPSTYAAIFGALVLGFVVYRKRKASR